MSDLPIKNTAHHIMQTLQTIPRAPYSGDGPGPNPGGMARSSDYFEYEAVHQHKAKQLDVARHPPKPSANSG
ncbi:MAG: hypothetical protein WBW94_15275 [Anaerolineales bacterium]